MMMRGGGGEEKLLMGGPPAPVMASAINPFELPVLAPALAPV